MKVFAVKVVITLTYLFETVDAFSPKFSKSVTSYKAERAPVKGKNAFDAKGFRKESTEVGRTIALNLSPIGAAGTAMGLLSPIFGLEAKAQAGALTFVSGIIGDPLDTEDLRVETKKRISSAKPILYTYGLSPFSTEAKQILEDYDVEVEQVGLEWFLLGAKGSELRLVLAESSPNQQTSLPHLYLKGESLGGLSTGGRNNEGISGLLQSGELDKILKRKR